MQQLRVHVAQVPFFPLRTGMGGGGPTSLMEPVPGGHSRAARRGLGLWGGGAGRAGSRTCHPAWTPGIGEPVGLAWSPPGHEANPPPFRLVSSLRSEPHTSHHCDPQAGGRHFWGELPPGWEEPVSTFPPTPPHSEPRRAGGESPDQRPPLRLRVLPCLRREFIV